MPYQIINLQTAFSSPSAKRHWKGTGVEVVDRGGLVPPVNMVEVEIILHLCNKGGDDKDVITARRWTRKLLAEKAKS